MYKLPYFPPPTDEEVERRRAHLSKISAPYLAKLKEIPTHDEEEKKKLREKQQKRWQEKIRARQNKNLPKFAVDFRRERLVNICKHAKGLCLWEDRKDGNGKVVKGIGATPQGGLWDRDFDDWADHAESLISKAIGKDIRLKVPSQGDSGPGTPK